MPRHVQRQQDMCSFRAHEGSWVDRLPDAPTFYPTAEEFADPVLYIRKLQSRVAAEHGLCTDMRTSGTWKYPQPLQHRYLQDCATHRTSATSNYGASRRMCDNKLVMIHNLAGQVLNNTNGDGKRFTFTTRQQSLRYQPSEELAPRRSFETSKYA